MEIGPPVPFLVDHVRHNAVDLVAILGLVEPVAEPLGQRSGGILGLVRLGR